MCDASITIEHRDAIAPLPSPLNSIVKNLIIDGRINQILAIVKARYVKFLTLLPCCTPPLKGLIRAFPACCTIQITNESPSTVKFSLYPTIDHRNVDVEPPSHISIRTLIMYPLSNTMSLITTDLIASSPLCSWAFGPTKRSPSRAPAMTRVCFGLPM